MIAPSLLPAALLLSSAPPPPMLNSPDLIPFVLGAAGICAAGAVAWNNKEGGGQFTNFFPGPPGVGGGSTPDVTFGDVAGLEECKESFEEVIAFLRNPKKFHDAGARLCRGVLLEGSPGVGKTLLAKAVAAESGVPFFPATGSEFVHMYVGVGPKRVKELFEKARKHPASIIFIDEIDAVARRRSVGAPEGGQTEMDNTLNQLLSEMDGINSSESNVVVIGCTNLVENLDPAILRGGRFDVVIKVPPPHRNARRGILGVHAKNKRLEDESVLDELAECSQGMSGADLESALNQAAIASVMKDDELITRETLMEAFENAQMGKRRKMEPGWRGSSVRRTIAVHEAGHAVVAYSFPGLLKRSGKVSILPTLRGMGGWTEVAWQDDEQPISIPKISELKRLLVVLLAGRAAEEVALGRNEVTTGAAQDLQQARMLASQLKGVLGFDGGDGFEETLLRRSYAIAKRIIRSRIVEHGALVRSLLEKDMVYAHEIRDILEL